MAKVTPTVLEKILTKYHNAVQALLATINQSITSHTGDSTSHTTDTEKNTWNAKAEIDDTVTATDKTWSSDKISKINVTEAKKVDYKPTYADGTITYIKDGTSYTTTNDKQWFYYTEDGILKNTIFIDGEELTIDGASVKLDDYVKKTSIKTTIDDTCTDEQVASALTVKTELDKKLTKSKVVELGEINDGARGVISSWHDDTIDGYFLSLDITDKDGKTKRLQFNSVDDNIELYNYDGTNWTREKYISTTSVADVGVTNKTTFVDSDISGFVTYVVKNGVCFVNIWGLQCATLGYSKTVLNNMPIPFYNGVGICLSEANGDGNTALFGFVNENGDLLIHCYETGINAYGTFSYPVAES